MLITVGFIMPDPEGWPSVFFHPELKLLLVVYVDDFKMSGLKESMSKGWELVGSRIDMDVPSDIGRYLGCDHVQELQVKLTVHDHPFAHLFDKSLPDPLAKEAAAAERTQDFWEVDAPKGVYIRHYCQPRKGYYVPDEEVIIACNLTSIRCTDFVQSTSEDDAVSEWDKYLDETGGYAQGKRRPAMWVGATYLFAKTCKDPKIAVASIKRDKNDAKKKARAQVSDTWTNCSKTTHFQPDTSTIRSKEPPSSPCTARSRSYLAIWAANRIFIKTLAAIGASAPFGSDSPSRGLAILSLWKGFVLIIFFAATSICGPMGRNFCSNCRNRFGKHN